MMRDIAEKWKCDSLRKQQGTIWGLVILRRYVNAALIRTNEASNSLAYHQSIICLQVKLEFATGVACAIAQAIGVHSYINIQEKLGELINQMLAIL